jgi:hypothetical protein
MSFQNCMELCLPPAQAGGVRPHPNRLQGLFTSPRKRNGVNTTHSAVDFNYIGGQQFNKKVKYRVYSPVEGVIDTKYGHRGRFGTVTVRDAEGFYHTFLHMINIPTSLSHGTNVSRGDVLGTMAGMGPKGPYHYDVHIHYQLRLNNRGNPLIDPIAFWEKQPQYFTAPLNPDDGDVDETAPFHYWQEPGAPTGSVEDYMPRQAAPSEFSAAGYALWTNRVPMHEPWNRVMMVDTPNLNAPSDEPEHNINHTPQLTDTTPAGSKLIGRLEGEEVIERGPFWRR